MPDVTLQTGDDPERRKSDGEPTPEILPESPLTGTLPGGFVLIPLTGIGRWVKLTHACGDEVTFVNPTGDRLDWYTGSHRCGGTGWQEGEQPGPEIGRNPSDLGADTEGEVVVDHFALVAHELDTMFGFMRHELESLNVTDDRFLDVCDAVMAQVAGLVVHLTRATKARRAAGQ